jgi:16S rRNA (guanine966-N2)-methyltransferase
MEKMPNPELRIIAGVFKNQKYFSPDRPATHPMSEKLKNALFNTLGDLEGLSVLDAYSGSGGIGLEAVSRGAAKVTFIDSNTDAQKAISGNIRKLKLDDRTQLLRISIQAWLKTQPKAEFNIIIADPPYNYDQTDILGRLADYVTPGGIFVLSLPVTAQLIEMPGLEVVADKKYGNSQLIFYRKSVAL